ncbi:endoglucanase B [Aspergillus campestris IBT 28561]|uniref:Endoglucanase B n=1 Tax=Aspergillus campestris (strain IBT 28561) TaxID=1392248 RepID=A0A2I1DFI7_ASPC2|nr:endoglucanase B [Aspergillus campestris IBT 28561]PKY08639.1 endoglucanase B [Aspergillus campestris IBT 28561]
MRPSLLLPLSVFLKGTWAALECPGSFEDISAADYVANLHPGWNVGNTLDAVPDEGSWNNPAVEAATFDQAKSAGFKSIRLPVTWADHFSGESPDWTVDEAWIQRVADVVDMITSRDLYTIVNVHHDSWKWADVTAEGANMTVIEERFYRLWYQIGTKLGCTSNLVAFEPINEPPCNDEKDAAEINKLNDIFLKAINDAGGFNAQRVVTLVGGGEDSVKTSQWFEAPTGYSNPFAIQFHYYSPYDFIFSAWGKTIWGSDADKDAVTTDFKLLRNNFTKIPLVLGEFDASPTNTEPAARWKYSDHLARTAAAHNVSYILWDNGLDHLDRKSGVWRDPVSISILNNPDTGVSNSLPDSTQDAATTTQQSSAYIFHQSGAKVTSQSLPFILNGNALQTIKLSNGTALKPNTDYTLTDSKLTFPASFLSRFFSATTAPGVRATLSLSFSAGAPSRIQLVQWDKPVLKKESAAASAVAGSDLPIPVTWKGLAKPAAVKALTKDGTYLVDDWTEYLGPLQQARATYSNHWNWDATNVILTADAIDAVVAAKQDTVFTFEFFPRVEGGANSVNFTLTV